MYEILPWLNAFNVHVYECSSITHLALNCKTEMAAHTRNVAYFVLGPYDYSDRHLARIALFHLFHSADYREVLSHSGPLACTAIAMNG